MKTQTAIQLSNIIKEFIIPHERYDTLREHFTHILRPRTYEKFRALDGITLSIPCGQFLGVIGNNGSGKSTLLKVMAGIIQPNRGTIRTEGTISPFLELGIGFQPELTGKENVYLYGAILGLSSREVKKRYQEIVEFSELERFMDQKVKNYSSGMAVRLAFSVAIQADADIYLIDEVLAVGDLSFQNKCFGVFERFKNQGKTIVFVSHDLGVVLRFSDRVIILDKGQIIVDGDPREVVDRYVKES
ncbi:MAG: ABC transporter ATP-binding protein [Anaplasmataceae bacterium]|nr:ABC transporter ATP-binding protein [Anaplasmataceae bacterium]